MKNPLWIMVAAASSLIWSAAPSSAQTRPTPAAVSAAAKHVESLWQAGNQDAGDALEPIPRAPYRAEPSGGAVSGTSNVIPEIWNAHGLLFGTTRN